MKLVSTNQWGASPIQPKFDGKLVANSARDAVRIRVKHRRLETHGKE